MSKAKTKKGPLETVATYQDYGAWEWDSGNGDRWAYKEGIGLNLFFILNGELKPTIYAKNLNDAIMYSLGHAGGRHYQKQLGG